MRYRRRSSPTSNDIKRNIVMDSHCILDISFIYYAWSLNEPAVTSLVLFALVSSKCSDKSAHLVKIAGCIIESL